MFGSSLFALQAKRRSRRWFILPLSIAVHMLALAGFVGAQYWVVGEVAEPPISPVYYVSLPPPPAAAAPARQHAAAVHPQAPRPIPQVAQPDPVAEVVTKPIPDPGPISEEPTVEGPVSGNPGIPGGTDPFGDIHGVPGVAPGGNGPVTAEPVTQEGPYPLGGAIVKPEVIPSTRIKPSYTEQARKVRMQGVVIVEAVIDAQGNVTSVKVVKPLPLGLDQQAVAAVQQWKYRPATLHGRPVAVILQLTVTFQVQ
jgi:TonB family protein